jgi:hypothetical protein
MLKPAIAFESTIFRQEKPSGYSGRLANSSPIDPA